MAKKRFNKNTANDISHLSDWFEELYNQMDDTLTDKKLMLRIGRDAVEEIQKRTRDGFGVNSMGGGKKQLKPLSPDYIKQRKRFKKLSSKTTASKSNLTLTGEMIDTMDARVSDGKIIIFSGKSDLVEFNEDMGRIFMNLSRDEEDMVYDALMEALAKNLKNL